VNPRKRNVKKPYVKPEIRSRAIRHGDIEAGSRFAQKRSVPRYPFAARAVIIEPLTRAEQSTRTSDIGLNGCYLESVDQFPPNTIVRLRIEQGEQIVETWGRVAHVQEGLGTGIAFFECSAEERLAIQGWIADVIAFLDKSRR
jgi:PilZ domain